MLFSYMEERFGIPERVFRGYLLFKRKRGWWLLRDSPLIPDALRYRVFITGLKAFNRVGSYVKPTTRLVQIFGHLATRARLEVGEDELRRLADGESLPTGILLENGYVILTMQGRALGLALLTGNRLCLQIPRRELSFLGPR